jgi:hypothetical protein
VLVNEPTNRSDQFHCLEDEITNRSIQSCGLGDELTNRSVRSHGLEDKLTNCLPLKNLKDKAAEQVRININYQ